MKIVSLKEIKLIGMITLEAKILLLKMKIILMMYKILIVKKVITRLQMIILK